jgi:CheY-specific phosphatase CheX
MMPMKYVNIDGIGIVMFSKHRDHKEMANLLIGNTDRKVVSAGFVVDWGKPSLSVYGESFSLHIGSHELDDETINKMIEG